MRIAFIVTRADDLGGAQVHVRDLATALRRMGHEVVVLAGAEPGILAQELEERSIPFRSLRHLGRPVRPLDDLRAIWEIRRSLRDIQPDLVSTHSSKAGALGRIAGRSLGTPTLFTSHGWAFSAGTTRLRRWAYTAIERALAPLSARIVTVCERDRELAIRKRVGKQDRMTAIHNGVLDVDRALQARPDRSPPQLLMVARFGRQKDHLTLFEALAGLQGLDWQLELVGHGARRALVEALARSLGLAPRVTFLGHRSDVADRMARSQVFLLISKWEGFPRSILEAMRGGLPVIASDVGGVREAVVDGETGFVVPPGDVNRLRDRLSTMIAEPDLRTRMGAAGRALYVQDFTFEHLLERTLAVYETVLVERRHASGYRPSA